MWRRFVSRRHLQRFSRHQERASAMVLFPTAFKRCALFCSGSSMAEVLAGKISMRLTDICHPEWGYLAPSRSSTWKMRLFIFAAAIGASASGAVCCSLVYRPVAGSVHCGAHVDARCRPERRRGKNDGDVPREAANRHLLAGRSRPRRGRRSPRSCRWRSPNSRATRLSKSRRSRRPISGVGRPKRADNNSRFAGSQRVSE